MISWPDYFSGSHLGRVYISRYTIIVKTSSHRAEHSSLSAWWLHIPRCFVVEGYHALGDIYSYVKCFFFFFY